MDAQAELDRLTAALAKALNTTMRRSALGFTDDTRYVIVGDSDRFVETAAHASESEAVAELRAILRADTDGAIAIVLDELAAEMERGPLTAEMLRTMAAARRAK
jgi:hypothetical protein